MTASGRQGRIELTGAPDGSTGAAVVVLNGARPEDLERSRAWAARLAGRTLLVAVDGGLDACRTAGCRPDLFVGDGDSCTAPPPGDLPGPRLPTDKERSDLAAALDELRARRVAVVVVAGLVGGRLDHEWANLLELGAHADGFAALLAPTARGNVLVTRRGCRLDTARGRTLSLFALGARARVTLLGPRWELRERELAPGSLGLSNEAGERLELTVHAGTAALVWDVD